MNQIITNDDINYLAKQDDLPLILSGMTALLQDSDNKVEKMQNQNWFQRMWKTVTGKNKATANEVQQNHEKLSAYMTQAMQILFERNVMTQQTVNNLGLQLNVLYQEHNHLKEMLGAFVEKLNEKIVSIDNFHMLSEEIRLKMYAKDKPVIAICKVVTQLDERSVNDPRKMQILQQSLVQEGILSENPIPLQELFMDLLTCTPEEAGQFILGLGAIRQHYLPTLFLEFMENYYYMPEMERKLKSKEKFCVHYLDMKQIESDITLTSLELYGNNVETLRDSFGMLGNPVESSGSLVFASDSAISSSPVPESNSSTFPSAKKSSPLTDFTIVNGCLTQYLGKEEEVVIPNGVKSIGEYAFAGCTTLSSVVIPDSVESIGEVAFADCTTLSSVVIPDSVESIGGFAFDVCTSLSSVVMGESVKSIEAGAFARCSSLNSIVIPDSVKSIGEAAFLDCTSLSSVVIGNSVQSIENATFMDCTSLSSVVIPNSVEIIGELAFNSCSSLNSVEIGSSVESIGDYALADCTSLTQVSFEGNPTKITMGDGVFQNTPWGKKNRY